jgi:hypothetical protein
MIRYKLTCQNGDDFEAWFRSSEDFDAQAEAGEIGCPTCGDIRVQKAPMAPAIVGGRGTDDQRKVAIAMAHKLAEHVRDNFDYVGERFPAEARAIRDGDAEDRPIWGEATPEEGRALREEGLAVAPLPAFAAPTPPKKLN